MDLLDKSALALGQMITERQISSPELTDILLKQIEAQDSQYKAFLTPTADLAREQARSVQQRIDAGESMMPLAGVPMAVKDNISTKGVRTSCASRMLWDYVPPYQATVMERLLTGGAVMLGKTNMDEFAMGSTTETSYGGPTRNPWQPEHVPGGSSGGSAAAVAAREAIYALGSDTGGSIRQPCSYCGLTGLKPTYGAVSRYGLVAYASSLDQIGPIAHTAADCAAILARIAGADGRDSTSMPADRNLDLAELSAVAALDPELAGNPAWDRLHQGNLAEHALHQAIRQNRDKPLQGVRIGIPQEYFGEGLQDSVRRSVLAAADILASQGAVCAPCHLPLVDEAIPAYYLIATAEASANLARYDGIQYGHRPDDQDITDLATFYSKARSEGFGPEVRRRIMLGTFALSSGYYDAYYLKALKARSLVQQAFRQALDDFDCLLGPVAPTTAPRLGDSLQDPLRMYLSDIYTVSANLAGLPALALPCGMDEQALPIGFQLTGQAFSEADLLRIGVAFQKVTSFHQVHPGQEVKA